MAFNLLALFGGIYLLKNRERRYRPVTPTTEDLPPPLDPELNLYYEIDGYDTVVWQYGYSKGSGENMHLEYTYILGNKAGDSFVTDTSFIGQAEASRVRQVILDNGTVIDDVRFFSSDVAVARLDSMYALSQGGSGDGLAPTAPQAPQGPQSPQGMPNQGMPTNLTTNPAWTQGGWSN